MPTPIHVVDAFADRPFAGNPAGVCPLAGPRPDAWMQNVAMEMNHAETAFAWPEGPHWRLRWFTPLVEVDLCGHATLATAHLLWQSGRATGPLHFETRSGRLTVTKSDAGIAMDFPALAVTAGPIPGIVVQSLGVVPTATGTTGMDLFVAVATEAEVRACRPDFSRLKAVPTRGIIVTAPADAGQPYDFVSRFFAPVVGIDEDPVTGSAHCALGPYWAGLLGRTTVTGHQASRRGGTVRVEVRGERVTLIGTAVTVLVGELPFD
jgi:PhzF family phenazine biosynthesis protein